MTWVPTIANCDQYMSERTGRYEWRKVRYDAAIRWMVENGLVDGMTVIDIGAGMTEFAYCMMHDWNLNIRYIPVDGGIDGVNLDHPAWRPPRDAHFIVGLEIIEHLHLWDEVVSQMKSHAARGVVLSTPNPRTTDVIAMDQTHVVSIWPHMLEELGFSVSEETFYGGVWSNGEPDSLLATWKNQ